LESLKGRERRVKGEEEGAERGRLHHGWRMEAAANRGRGGRRRMREGARQGGGKRGP